MRRFTFKDLVGRLRESAPLNWGPGSSSPLDGEPRRDFVKRVVGTAAGLGLVGGSFGQPALADVTVDPNAIKYTKGGAKYVVAKEGGCPLSDKLGVLGSCAPKTGTKNRLPTHGCIEFNMQHSVPSRLGRN